MDGYIAKGLRRKRIFRCAYSNGSNEIEASVMEIAAYNKTEAEAEYRKRKGGMSPLLPVMAIEMERE